MCHWLHGRLWGGGGAGGGMDLASHYDLMQQAGKSGSRETCEWVSWPGIQRCWGH